MSDSLWQRSLAGCGPWDCPGNSTGWVAIPYSRESSRPRRWIRISCLLHCRCTLYHCATWVCGRHLLICWVTEMYDTNHEAMVFVVHFIFILPLYINVEMFIYLLEGTQAYVLFCIINDIHVKNGEMELYISCCHFCFLLTVNACRLLNGCLPWIASFTMALNMPPGISVSVSAGSLTHAEYFNICTQINA